MKKNRAWILPAAVGLLASTGLYWWPSDAASLADSPRRTVQVEYGPLERAVIATGVIRPMVGAEIKVGSRISGTVARLPVKVGDRVTAGQLLAELDARELDAAVAEARAEVALAEPRVALADTVLDRRHRLADAGLTAAEALDVARRDLEVERARLGAGKARLRAAEIRLAYARITAPISGVVAEVTTREGETVAAGFSAPTFVTLVDLDRLEVLAYVDETDIGRITVGQSASFTVDTYADVEFDAVVSAIEPKAELQGSVVSYVARLDFNAGEGYVHRPEMTAHVRLVLDRRQALTLPRTAIQRRDGRSQVRVERAGEWVEQVVGIGWRSADSVEILSGLELGETVELNPI